jgi:hypothetical protein
VLDETKKRVPHFSFFEKWAVAQPTPEGLAFSSPPAGGPEEVT